MTTLPMPTIIYHDDKKEKWQSITATADLKLSYPLNIEISEYGADEKEALLNLTAELNKIKYQVNKQIASLVSSDEPELFIYHITRDDVDITYDVNIECVIVAPTPEEAVEIAMGNARDEGAAIWKDTGKAAVIGIYTGPHKTAHVMVIESLDA